MQRRTRISLVTLIVGAGALMLAGSAWAGSASSSLSSYASSASLVCGYHLGSDETSALYTSATLLNEGKVSSGIATTLLIDCTLSVWGRIDNVRVRGGLTSSGKPTYEWVKGFDPPLGGQSMNPSKNGNVAGAFSYSLWWGDYRLEVLVKDALWKDPVGSGTSLSGIWSLSYTDSNGTVQESTVAETPLTVDVVTCEIFDTTTGASYASLQAAQDAAGAGDAVTLRGACTDPAKISKALTITGVQPKGYAAPTLEWPTLEAGAALTISGITLNGSPPSCLIQKDGDSHTYYGTLADAVGAAASGDTIDVTGSCVGTTEIAKDLTITGLQPDGYGTPTLDGGQIDRVLKIDTGANVTINTLTITGGKLPFPDPNTPNIRMFGGGVLNGGTLTLHDTTISGNQAPLFCFDLPYSPWHRCYQGYGGGVYNDGGTLTLNGSTFITDNRADNGGGIYTKGGTVTLNDTSSITNNRANSFDGGGITTSGGAVTPNDSGSISGNRAAQSGGGVDLHGGSLTLSNTSSISGNQATWGGGGGVHTFSGAVSMNDDSQISGNTAAGDGGGITMYLDGSLTMTGHSHINDNTAASGGGIAANHPGMYTGAFAGAYGDPGVNVYNNTPDNIYIRYPL
jgi:hypothetical protein